MTESGEELTLKGENGTGLKSVFAFNQAMGVSYAMDMEDRGKVEIKMTYPDDLQQENYQMVFVLKGKVGFRRKGEALNYGEIETYQHNLFRLALGFTRIMLDNVDDEVVCINLSHSFVSALIPASHPAHQQLTSLQNTEMPMSLFPINMHITPEIGAILQRLSNSSQSGFCDQLMLESKAIELLALQISQYEQLQAGTDDPYVLENKKRERMQQAREILISHTGKQLSLRELAHLVGTNEFDLKRDFKAVFGNTVYGYLKQYKMEQAKTMLIGKDITVAEISQKMGYKHATHFTSAFKKYFGYLPNKIKSVKIILIMLVQDFSVVFEGVEYLMGT